MGETIQIPKLGLRRIVPIEVARYDYATDKARCPVCKGLGFPWGGWFSCDDCGAVALVAAFGEWPAGQTFIQTTRAIPERPTLPDSIPS
jgi:hypothetical protein